MRGATKLLLATALVLLLATGFAACGSDDSDDSTAGSTPSATQETTATTPTDDRGSANRESEPGDERGGASKGSDDSGGSASPSDDSGGSSDSSDSGKSGPSEGSSSPEEGSAAFRTPGGDNSIQNFGEEADAAEVGAATTALIAYMQARAAEDWAKQCAYLATATLKPIEQLGSRAPQLKGKACPELLSALSGAAPASTRANTMTGGIDSLRVEGERGFALYHGTGGADYFVPMIKEDDKWKVGALAPSEFPG